MDAPGGIHMDDDRERLNQVARVAQQAALLMLGNGGETYRAEETVRHICRAFGYESEVIAFPTGIMLTIGSEKSLIARVSRRQVDFSKIDRVNAISRELASGACALSDAEDELSMLLSRPLMGWLRQSLIAAGSSSMFTLMFGGTPFDLAAAGASAFLAQTVVGRLNDEAGLPLVSLVGGSLTALMALVVTEAFHMGDVNRIIISGLMPLLPGLAITNAIRDAMRGDLVSGMARAGEAIIRAVVLAAGAGLSISAWMLLRGGA
jgi:uncharacterized membrane protein YjjP (DUF1212 family)